MRSIVTGIALSSKIEHGVTCISRPPSCSTTLKADNCHESQDDEIHQFDMIFVNYIYGAMITISLRRCT
jgi:hypothetical protein